MNRLTKRIALALGTAAALAGGAALAQQGMARMGPHDPFGNATVTRAEAQAKAAEMFGRMDLNGDGKLDQADRALMIGKRFDAMDANHDGMLSKQEFIDAHQKAAAGMRGAAMRPGMMRAPGAGMRMLGRMDANGDHAITRDEFIAGALKRFDAADADHDGKLTPEERRAAMREGMKMMHTRHMGGPGMPDHGTAGHDMGDMSPPPPPPAH